MEPSWVTHAILWHVYPLGFTGADPSGADRSAGRGLDALTAWLDYAVELGVSGLALGPVFASATHGYDTTDYFRIDDRLGDEAAFDRLVAEAHGRGLKVLLDGVFNHVGPGFRPGDEAFLRKNDDGSQASFEGHDQLRALDHGHPGVADLVAGVMTHWLARGADGWRLDAAYSVPPRFWAAVLPRVRAEFPDAYVYGEVLHGDYTAAVTEGGLDAVTQYELWKAVWSSINDGNFFELAWALKRHGEMLGTFVPQTFVGNHDVTRIASRLDDDRHFAHALVLLFTVPGTPSVYYGDEQGFHGVKEDRAGGDDAVRPAFPASPGELSPLGEPVYRLHQGLIGLRRRHPWLHRAHLAEVHLSNEAFVYDVTSPDDDARLRVLLNLADAPFTHDGETVPPHGWLVTGPGERLAPST